MSSVGDCEVGIVRKKKIKKISLLHSEKDLLKNNYRNGYVYSDKTSYQVSVFSSFGNSLFKDILSQEPLFSTFDYCLGDLLIIGCDGLWDYLK